MNIHNIKYTICALAMLLGASACRDNNTLVFDPEDKSYVASMGKSLEGQFHYLWNGINNSYVFWEYDPLDWDCVYSTFAPRFRELDEQAIHGKAVTNEDVRKLMEESFGKLLDRHMVVGMINVHNPEKDRQNVSVNISDLDIKSRPDYHPSTEVDSSYVPTSKIYHLLNYRQGTRYDVSNLVAASEFAEISTWFAFSCVLNGDIPYLHMSQFLFSGITHTAEMASVFQNFFNNVKRLKALGMLKGVVLDYRGNGGGFAIDLDIFPGMFIDEPELICRFKTKTGLGRYDYGTWIYRYMQPARESIRIKNFNAPLVVLQDMFTGSMGEISAYAVSRLPFGHTIGENTAGGLGTLFDDGFDIYHTGGFNVNNRWNQPFVYCATYCSNYQNEKTGEWECREGKGGFAPDEYVPLDTIAFNSYDHDNQLDAALDYIKGQSK